ncbi:MAG: beta-propeller domain-containing protein [Myxococcales bacterium]|nr:beta-propeller domain-containing protein [Myxococcales bacterium]
MNTSFRWVAAASLIMSACGADDPTLEDSTPGPQDPEVITSTALLTFDSCQDLETYLQDTAIAEMTQRIEASADSYGIANGGGVPIFDDVEAPEADSGPEEPISPPSSGDSDRNASPEDFTDTNTQVAGVDEPDFVKTDGVNTFVLTGQTLLQVRSWPPSELELQNSITIPGWPREMFLDEEGRVLVLSVVWPEFSEPGIEPGIEPQPILCGPRGCGCGPWGCGGQLPYTQLTIVSTNDGLNIEESHQFPGQYNAARRIGDISRLVLNQEIRFPSNVDYWLPHLPPSLQGTPEAEALWARLIEENTKKIQEHPFDAWFPPGTFPEDPTNAELEELCQGFHRPTAPTPLGLMSVATINVSTTPATINMTSVLAPVGQIYASAESLYVTYTEWFWSSPANEDTIKSAVHKFDIQDENGTQYIGSGTFPGRILNQFSMDEYDDHFRVATTRETWLEDDDGRLRPTQSNGLSILKEEEDGTLMTVGELEGLAPNERITSARFIGPRGFVVTFRNIDPLFTIDLSDPTDPKVVGELKIPGFSTYLHPLDEDHLLALGEDFPEPDENGNLNWSERSLKISIFDVSDFSNPTEKYIHRLGSVSSSSEALWNHKAFNYFAANKTLAIPFTDYRNRWGGGDRPSIDEPIQDDEPDPDPSIGDEEPGDEGPGDEEPEPSDPDPVPPPPENVDIWSRFVSEVRVFTIDVDEGIQPAGALSMSDIFAQRGQADWSYIYSPEVRRSIMADEYIYGITDAGIRVASLADPSIPIATVVFSDEATPEEE